MSNTSEPPEKDQPLIPATGNARALGVGSKWLVLLAVGIGTFMSALDGSVVNIVLPVVSNSFHTVLVNVEWIVTIYLLVLSGLLLSFGRLGDLRGHKTVYLSGFIIFILGSALSGLSPSVQALIFFRGLQATGAAMLSSNSPAILTKNFPVEQRGQALGMQATMTYLGLTVGPSLGGWLATQFSWRAVFYINVPVGLFAIWLSLLSIPHDTNSEPKEHFDLTGAAVFIAGLSALLLALNQGEAWGWTSLPILALLVVALITLAIFLRIETRIKSPMLDLSLFKKRIFSLSVTSAIFNYICVYTILFLMPFYLIDGRHLSPVMAGLWLTAQPIVMAVVAPISGTLSDRFGTRLPSALGMGILAVGLWLLSRLGSVSPAAQVMFALAVVGLGTGAFISPNNSALMGSAPRQRQGIAAGILATSRNFGMVLGVGFAGAIYTTVLVHAQPTIGGQSAIFNAYQVSFMAASVIAILGTLTSLVREQ